MRVEYHPEAAEDLNCATDHYNAIRAGLGDALRVEVYSAIERLTQNPNQLRIVANEIRRCLVHRFPYSVLFRVISPDLIRILAIRPIASTSSSVSNGNEAQQGTPRDGNDGQVDSTEKPIRARW